MDLTLGAALVGCASRGRAAVTTTAGATSPPTASPPATTATTAPITIHVLEPPLVPAAVVNTTGLSFT